MHCTMEDLVAVRDGEGSTGARRHLEDCAACRAELDALYQRVAQLKALPALRPPRDRWDVVRAELVATQRRRRRWWGTMSLAAAAAVAGLIVFRPWSGGTRCTPSCPRPSSGAPRWSRRCSSTTPTGGW